MVAYIIDMIRLVLIGMSVGFALAVVIADFSAANVHHYQLEARHVEELCLSDVVARDDSAALGEILKCWPEYASKCDRALGAELEISGTVFKTASITLWDRSRALYFGDNYRILAVEIEPYKALRYASQNELKERGA